MLEKSAEELANKAEDLNDISLFIKSNVLRKEVKDKLLVVKNIEQSISEKKKDLN